MKLLRFFLPALTVALFSSSAFGLTLEEAKRQGVVGETPSGYLESITSSPEAHQVVQEINQKRAQAYKEIAAKNGTDVTVVAQLAGKEAIQKASAGMIVKLPSGQWQKK